MKTIYKNQKNRNLAIMAILLFTAIISTNATTIKGRILDSSSRPINYATATLIDPNTKLIVVGDMSDAQGNFIIENVKSGDYILSFRIVGYEKDETRKINVDENIKQYDIKDITLIESNIVLNELEVISTKETALLEKKIQSYLAKNYTLNVSHL